MFAWLMRRGLAAFERKWHYDARYVHEMIDADFRAAFMFQRAAALGKYRKDVPAAAWAAAGITAVRHEDCGPCTQLAVSMAEQAGVEPQVLRAVLKAVAALNVIEGADRVAAFLVGALRKGWRDDFSVTFGTINDLPGLIISAPERLVQTNAFEIDAGVVKAIYVVRNPDKLKHLA